MELDLFQKYLIVINIFSFCLFTIDYVIYLQTDEGIKPKWICEVITVIGGSVGALIAFVFWDRKLNKRNITWRVFTVCMLIIHIVIYFLTYGILEGSIKWKGLSNLITGVRVFAQDHRWYWHYLLGINLLTFILFAIDKVRAIQGRWRIRELILLGLSLVGGTIGGLIAMYTLRHKIKSPQFAFGLPMMILAQIFLIVYWIVRSL